MHEGEDHPGELNRSIREMSPNGYRIKPFDEEPLMENLHLANTYYDKNVPGDIATRVPAIGSLVSFFKRLVRKAVGWFINPALDNQRLFNVYTIRSVNEIKRYLDHLQINEDIMTTIMNRELALFRANILFLNRYIERSVASFEDDLRALRSGGLSAVPCGVNGERRDMIPEIDVLALEQRLHGSTRAVRDKQKLLLKHFKGCASALAIGCGRGELLQLLSAEGVTVKGIEANPALVDYCRDHDLDVVRTDPVEYLEGLPGSSLGGVALSRFAGHQPPARLLRLLKACCSRLVPGGVLVIETPNPFSLYAVASYTLEDYQRMHPLHPEILKLLCLSAGFIEPEVIFSSPLPPEEHLEDIQPLSGSPEEQQFFKQVSNNFLKINQMLFSHRDYTLVAKALGTEED